MNSLNFKTRALRQEREEARARKMPCLAEPIWPRTRKKLPAGFLSSRSPLMGFYYAKHTRGPRSGMAERSSVGMRWNWYLSKGKRTPRFALPEHHTTPISDGRLKSIRTEKRKPVPDNGQEKTAGCAVRPVETAKAKGRKAVAAKANATIVPEEVVSHIPVPHQQFVPVMKNAENASLTADVKPPVASEPIQTAAAINPSHASRCQSQQPGVSGTTYQVHSISERGMPPVMSRPPAQQDIAVVQAPPETREIKILGFTVPKVPGFSVVLPVLPAHSRQHSREDSKTPGIVAKVLDFAANAINVHEKPQAGIIQSPQKNNERRQVGYYGSPEKRKVLNLKVAQADALPPQ